MAVLCLPPPHVFMLMCLDVNRTHSFSPFLSSQQWASDLNEVYRESLPGSRRLGVSTIPWWASATYRQHPRISLLTWMVEEGKAFSQTAESWAFNSSPCDCPIQSHNGCLIFESYMTSCLYGLEPMHPYTLAYVGLWGSCHLQKEPNSRCLWYPPVWCSDSSHLDQWWVFIWNFTEVWTLNNPGFQVVIQEPSRYQSALVSQVFTAQETMLFTGCCLHSCLGWYA